MKRTICFDGPIYDHLDYAKDESSLECQKIKKALSEKIDSLIKEGECVFMSGVRRGIEMWTAEIVLDKMELYPNASLICVCPYEEQPTHWNENHRERYFTIHQLCSKLVMLNRYYERDSYQKLDNYLLEHCDTVISVAGEESRLIKKAKQMHKIILTVE